MVVGKNNVWSKLLLTRCKFFLPSFLYCMCSSHEKRFAYYKIDANNSASGESKMVTGNLSIYKHDLVYSFFSFDSTPVTISRRFWAPDARGRSVKQQADL